MNLQYKQHQIPPLGYDLLMPKLISGEFDKSEPDIDDPEELKL